MIGGDGSSRGFRSAPTPTGKRGTPVWEGGLEGPLNSWEVEQVT